MEVYNANICEKSSILNFFHKYLFQIYINHCILMNYELIEVLRNRKKIPKMDFYSQIGMTHKGFNQMMENESIKVSTLQKIAEVLGVHVSYFFGSVTPNLTTTEDRESHSIYLDTPAPFDPAATEEIMSLDLPISEKVKMLRETIGMLKIQVSMLQRMNDAKDATIEKLKSEKGIS